MTSDDECSLYDSESESEANFQNEDEFENSMDQDSISPSLLVHDGFKISLLNQNDETRPAPDEVSEVKKKDPPIKSNQVKKSNPMKAKLVSMFRKNIAENNKIYNYSEGDESEEYGDNYPKLKYMTDD